MIAVDSNFIPYLLNRATRVPFDPATGKPIEYLQERIELLLETLQEDGETIIVPTPVLSEFLVLANADGQKYLEKIDKNPLFQIRPFDRMAAIELAAIRLSAQSKLSKSKLKRQKPEETWAKISFDRQIVAIAKVYNAHTIYSDDDGVAKFAAANKIKPVRLWELPRPKEIQGDLFKDGNQEAAELEVTSPPSNVTSIAERRAVRENPVANMEANSDE